MERWRFSPQIIECNEREGKKSCLRTYYEGSMSSASVHQTRLAGEEEMDRIGARDRYIGHIYRYMCSNLPFTFLSTFKFKLFVAVISCLYASI